MGFRFRKSIKIAPWLKINLSKSGISTSIGKPGATVNIGHGKITGTAGIPGTGLSFRESISTSTRSKNTREISAWDYAAEVARQKLIEQGINPDEDTSKPPRTPLQKYDRITTLIRWTCPLVGALAGPWGLWFGVVASILFGRARNTSAERKLLQLEGVANAQLREEYILNAQ